MHRMKTFFVDESGDLGAKGKYFVIVLLAPQNGKRISNFMRKFCATNKLDEVKGRKDCRWDTSQKGNF